MGARFRRTHGAAILVACAALAGCGGGGSEPAGSGGDGGASKPATSGSGGGSSKSTSVTIKDFEFKPATITVKRGASVKWTDEDASNHNVMFDKDGPKDIGNLDQGESGKVTFDEPGTYRYVCTYHPNMVGTVKVR